MDDAAGIELHSKAGAREHRARMNGRGGEGRFGRRGEDGSADKLTCTTRAHKEQHNNWEQIESLTMQCRARALHCDDSGDQSKSARQNGQPPSTQYSYCTRARGHEAELSTNPYNSNQFTHMIQHNSLLHCTAQNQFSASTCPHQLQYNH